MVVGAVLVAGLATGCQPRMGEFEVTNATDDTLVLWDVRLRPGATHEFEIDPPDCVDLVLFSADGEHRALVPPVCEDDHVTVTAEDLEEADAAVVVNATQDLLELRYVGWSSIRTGPLVPGAELRIPLSPTEARCGDDEYEQPELVVVRRLEPYGEEVVARHWDDLCAGTRWVLDDAALAAGAPASIAVTNRAGVPLRVWPGGDAGDTWTEDVTIQPDATMPLQLAFPRGGCETAGVNGETPIETGEIRLRDDLDGPCDGELVITRADLVHYVATEGWVPLDPTEGVAQQ